MRIEGVEGVDEEVVKMALEAATKKLEAFKAEHGRRMMVWSLINTVWSLALLIVTAYMAARLWH